MEYHVKNDICNGTHLEQESEYELIYEITTNTQDEYHPETGFEEKRDIQTLRLLIQSEKRPPVIIKVIIPTVVIVVTIVVVLIFLSCYRKAKGKGSGGAVYYYFSFRENGENAHDDHAPRRQHVSESRFG